MTRAEQFYYTWSEFGLSGRAGYDMRAVSDKATCQGIDASIDGQLLLSYRLPERTDLRRLLPERAPLSLKLCNVNGRRVLAQRSYAGTDSIGRPGIYFVHGVIDLPADFHPERAIGTWRAPFWKRSDQDLDRGTVELPGVDMEEDLEESNRKALDFESQLKDEEIMYVVRAFLQRESDEQIYIVARPDKVAAAVALVTQVFPHTMTANLTFNTYEDRIDSATETLVGTCGLDWDDDEATYDLPAALYAKGIVLNTYTGSRTELREDETTTAYAEFVVKSLRSGARANIDEVMAVAGEWQSQERRGFLLAYKLFDGTQELADSDLLSVLGNAVVARAFVAKEPLANSVIRLATRNTHLWNQRGRLLYAALVASAQEDSVLSERLSKMVEICLDRAVSEFDSGNLRAARVVLQQIVVPGASDGNAVAHLSADFVNRISKGESLHYDRAAADDASELVLEYAVRGKDFVHADAIAGWIPNSLTELVLLAGRGLPAEWLMPSLAQCLFYHQEVERTALRPSRIMNRLGDSIHELLRRVDFRARAGYDGHLIDFYGRAFADVEVDKVKEFVFLLSLERSQAFYETLLSKTALTWLETADLLTAIRELRYGNLLSGESLRTLFSVFVQHVPVEALGDTSRRSGLLRLLETAAPNFLEVDLPQKRKALINMANYLSRPSASALKLRALRENMLHFTKPEQMAFEELVAESVGPVPTSTHEVDTVIRTFGGDNTRFLKLLLRSACTRTKHDGLLSLLTKPPVASYMNWAFQSGDRWGAYDTWGVAIRSALLESGRHDILDLIDECFKKQLRRSSFDFSHPGRAGWWKSAARKSVTPQANDAKGGGWKTKIPAFRRSFKREQS